jgi:hypothetical protein
VTIRAISGLFALNGAFAVMGLTLLWAFRGFTRWADVLRLAGVGYLIGVAAFGGVWTQLLVVGVPFGGWAIVLSLLLASAVACAAGVRLGRPRPAGFGWSVTRDEGSSASLLVTATGVALVGLLLEAFFRSARLQSLQAFDAWAFWVPKAKAIYYFGGLDDQVFTTSAGPTYPPIVPILDAAAFHAMGTVDTVTFHLQFWFLVTGAVAAIVGGLHRHAPAWLLWPSIVLVMVVPRFGGRLLIPQADVLVDVLFAVGALLLVLWLADRRGWRLAAVAVLFAGATLTKREGLLFAAIALAVAVAATWRSRRAAWPVLGAVAAVVVAAAIPWRLWYRSHDLTGEAPPSLGVAASLDRALDSLRLSADVLFDTSLWSVVPFVLLIALAAAFAWGDRRLAAFVGALIVLVFLGGAWVTYSYALPVTADESVNPIVRYTGAIIVLASVSIPLLLASAWRGPPEEAG